MERRQLWDRERFSGYQAQTLQAGASPHTPARVPRHLSSGAGGEDRGTVPGKGNEQEVCSDPGSWLPLAWQDGERTPLGGGNAQDTACLLGVPRKVL